MAESSAPLDFAELCCTYQRCSFCPCELSVSSGSLHSRFADSVLSLNSAFEDVFTRDKPSMFERDLFSSTGSISSHGESSSSDYTDEDDVESVCSDYSEESGRRYSVSDANQVFRDQERTRAASSQYEATRAQKCCVSDSRCELRASSCVVGPSARFGVRRASEENLRRRSVQDIRTNSPPTYTSVSQSCQDVRNYPAFQSYQDEKQSSNYLPAQNPIFSPGQVEGFPVDTQDGRIEERAMSLDSLRSTVCCECGEEESLDSGIPLTCEDGECRTPEMLAEMYQQENCLRVIEEEKKRRRLLEDSGPYTGSLQRRDKRRRQDHRQSLLSHVYDNTGYYPSNRDSVIFASSNSLVSANCTLRRANTICSADPATYLRNRCNRESVMSQGSELSYKRHSKSTFDSGFESGLSDILDEILGAAVYDPVLEGDESPKTKWQSFKNKLSDAFVKVKNKDIPDNISDTSDIKTTRWRKVQKFVKVKLARLSQQDVDMGGFEDDHWRSLEPRQFHRGTRRTQSMVKWKNRREE